MTTVHSPPCPPATSPDVGALEGLGLLRQLTPSAPVNRPSRVPVQAVELLPVFDQRGWLDPEHVDTLVRVLANGAKLPPLSVLEAGGRLFLVDGQYRLAAHTAYAARFGRTRHKVAVAYFEGSPEQAFLSATARNGSHGIPLTSAQRSNAAWRMTLMGGLTRSQINEATLVSPRRLTDMNRVKAELGERAPRFAAWLAALGEVRGARDWGGLSEDDIDARHDEEALDMANRTTRVCGASLVDKPEVLARMVEILAGRNRSFVIAELVARNPVEEDPEADF